MAFNLDNDENDKTLKKDNFRIMKIPMVIEYEIMYNWFS